MLVYVEGTEQVGREGSEDPGEGLVLDDKQKVVVGACEVLLLLLEEVCGEFVAAVDDSSHELKHAEVVLEGLDLRGVREVGEGEKGFTCSSWEAL